MTNPNPLQQLDPVDPPPDLPLRASEEIQGNILAGFQKDHQIFLLLTFSNPTRTRAWLNELTPRIATTRQVATFNAQFSNARRLRGGDDPEQLKAVWLNIGITAHGLLAISPDFAADMQEFEAFRDGPVPRAAILRDEGLSTPNRWVFGGPQQQAVDAILTVAADDPNDLQMEIDKMRALATKHGLTVAFEQRGDTLPDERVGHEHFGFKDGISQPGVRGFHPVNPAKPNERLGHPGTEMIAAGEFVVGLENETGTTARAPEWMRNGSFQVFRRLRQDVPGWWSQVTRQTQSLPSDDPMKEDLLAAKLVGRWRSGTPLAQAPDRDNRSERDGERDNDFKFDDDFEGLKTPVFSHIRKMYPRNRGFSDNEHRIMRRGIPFGQTFDPTAGRGHGVDADRGLIFNVFMANIENQFEFLQQTWANNASFPDSEAGPDPVIGEDPSPVKLRREGLADRQLDFRRFVHTTGGIYAFAPSLTTLRGIANGDIPKPIPGGLHVGGKATIETTGGLPARLRAKPSLSGAVLALLQPGTRLTLLEGPRPADGHNWWRVRTDDKREGWVSAILLKPVP